MMLLDDLNYRAKEEEWRQKCVAANVAYKLPSTIKNFSLDSIDSPEKSNAKNRQQTKEEQAPYTCS